MSLELADDAFGQRTVVGITDAAEKGVLTSAAP
jgi:hypothetical protein